MKNRFTFLLAGLLCLTLGFSAQAAEKIPVIYDSDIGDDIDDTWALGLLLQSPEFDLKLVVGDHGKTMYRAKLFAKLLETAGRADVPVGIGLDINVQGGGAQSEWVEGYNLNTYPGKIYPDGVQALIDTIMSSPEPITLICVGPLPNIKEALKREPRIVEKARFVGMHGSVRLGYGGSKDIAAEYNVKQDPKACQVTLSALWDITITPLDTCGLVDLQGELYKKFAESQTPIAKAILENFRIWTQHHTNLNPEMWKTQSSTLFDTVAVHLGRTTDFLKMETLSITVTEDGFTQIDDKGKSMQVATEWLDKQAFLADLVNRLTAE
ncbi:MAG: nucleoside hydrolase [bacterium]|jgi:inosine-uridine nucleoside N-ribohydrolase|nr:nucleoside hydrolase [bacterium]